MPKLLRFTPEFKAQAVRLVFELMKPTESRKEACRRLAPKVNVKEVTLYNWVKEATAPTATVKPPAGSVKELRGAHRDIQGLIRPGARGEGDRAEGRRRDEPGGSVFKSASQPNGRGRSGR